MTLQQLLTRMPALTEAEQNRIADAYHFSEEAHRPQKRKSGEPYFIHVAAVADILAALGLDTTTIISGLLHDVVEDTRISLEDIQTRYGGEVARLVDGVTKMDNGAGEAAFLQKTITAMSDDVRVILIKLADRLHNMRTLASLKPQRQREIAQETMELFAPLATRLGIWALKSELEDLCFQYLEPRAYATIHAKLQEQHAEIEAFYEHIRAQVLPHLAEMNMQADVVGRSHHLMGIWKDMKARGISFEESYHIRGARILVETPMDCYQVLGVIHQIWKPVPGQFNDYIAAPKDSYYQSLHTTVFFDTGGPAEIQIRTYDMDYRADFGIAAYWRYKNDPNFNAQLERPMAQLRSLIEPARDEDTPQRFVQSVIENIDTDRIYVFTPRGDILDLPRGATPLDFAYHIHTEVGHRARAARVNGRLVTLDYCLEKGDKVEIFTTKRGGPRLQWLDESRGFVHTNRARSALRAWFNKQNKRRLVENGRAALDEELTRMGVAANDAARLLGVSDHDRLEDLLRDIGRGDIAPADIISAALSRHSPPTQPVYPVGAVPIIGARGYTIKLARCCNPQPGQDIVGYITQQGHVSIHRTDCRILNTQPHLAERLIPVAWATPRTEGIFAVPVELETIDRAGMMGEIGLVVANENINLSKVSIYADNGLATFHITMEVDSYASLSRALSKLAALEGVLSARRSVADPNV
ncbi:MAG: RelA/SpoT family protein [Anaerolineales bacterium]